MSSLRSLMKSSALSKRIVHPYARYSPSGQLICTACSMNIKGEVLWPSHLSSKVHRNSVKREKEEQEQLSQAIPKRRAAQEEGESIHEQESAKRVRFNSSEMENVRVFSQESETSTTTASEETQQPEASTSSAGFLPPGFFDRPEEAPLAQEQETEGREEDDEWAAFEATLATEEELPVPSTSALTSAPAAATISAPEVLFEDGEDEHGQNGQQAEAEEEAEDDENQETEQEKREREEREELMQRIEIEEREQQEADERVDSLKKRLMAIRNARSSQTKSSKDSSSTTNGAPPLPGPSNGKDAKAEEFGFGRKRGRKGLRG